MIEFIDIGVNLTSPAFDRDREEVASRAAAAGVTTLVITSSSIESSVEAAAYAGASRHAHGAAKCCATAGVHPHNAKDWDAASGEKLENLAAAQESFAPVAAIGECGLDYNRNFSPPPAQRICFEEQLALAAKLKKPVFLHERDAFDDFISILKQYRAKLPGAVVHCFTGCARELEAYLALDCSIGITGWLCDERRGGHLSPLLRRIPADRLLLETDAPYLLPRSLPPGEKKKSGRNEPRFLPHIAAYAASILGKPLEQLAEETSANAKKFFLLV